MLARVLSAAVNGIEAFPVEVEVNCGWGDTVIVTVGLADAAVKESRDRVTAALTNSGFKFPMGRCTINLAPADVGIFEQTFDDEIDMAEVKGQESVKRAVEIAAAGGHNVLMLHPINLQAKSVFFSQNWPAPLSESQNGWNISLKT
jgi:magnesium chelatase family protein